MNEKLKAIVARLFEIEGEIEELGDEIVKSGNLVPTSLEILGEELSALGAVRYTLEKLLADWEA